MQSPESLLPPILQAHPVTWQDVCAYLRKQDDWMKAMAAWADTTQNWFISHDQGGNTTPPQPPPPRWP